MEERPISRQIDKSVIPTSAPIAARRALGQYESRRCTRLPSNFGVTIGTSLCVTWVKGILKVSSYQSDRIIGIIYKMETEQLIVLDVHSAGSKFSQECPVCCQTIVYMASVSYCQCNIHFHPKCFLQMLNGKNLTNEPKINCLYCRAAINVEYKVEFEAHFNRDRCTFGNSLLILALLLFIGTLVTSIIVLLGYENGEDDIKAAVSCIVMLVSFVGIGSASFKIFMVFFLRKIVTAVSVKHIDKSLEFSAFRNMHDIEPESDHKLTPL